jgi:hypothetical protein
MGHRAWSKAITGPSHLSHLAFIIAHLVVLQAPMESESLRPKIGAAKIFQKISPPLTLTLSPRGEGINEIPFIPGQSTGYSGNVRNKNLSELPSLPLWYYETHLFLSPDVSRIAVARPWRRVCHRAAAGDWIRGVLEQYVVGSDTRGRPEGRSYPRLQQAIRETSGLVTDKTNHGKKTFNNRCHWRQWNMPFGPRGRNVFYCSAYSHQTDSLEPDVPVH